MPGGLQGGRQFQRVYHPSTRIHGMSQQRNPQWLVVVRHVRIAVVHRLYRLV
jgi:hypothetical protein